MDYLRDALAEDSGNRRPRMKSFLALADLHLEDREYELAQAYYDSTLANLDEDHPRFQEVSNNAKSSRNRGAAHGHRVERQLPRHLQLGRGRYARMEIIEGLRIAKKQRRPRPSVSLRKRWRRAWRAGAATAFWPYNPTLRDNGRTS